jgi:hypothetical protein
MENRTSSFKLASIHPDFVLKKSSSCVSDEGQASALIQMYDSWIEGFEDDEVSAVLMLDMSTSFGVVHHEKLLSKLALYIL